MKQRIINALNSQEIFNMINHPSLFAIFLRGGYEDFFSKQLFGNGFEFTGDLRSQCKIIPSHTIDIAQLNNDLQVTAMVEFGHQFSLQFNRESALDKLKNECKHRTHTAMVNSDLYHVHIITDVINIYIDFPWVNYFRNRYGISTSINNRQAAIDRINQTEDTIEQFNQSKNIEPGELLTLEIENQFGSINLNFLINGPYNHALRLSI